MSNFHEIKVIWHMKCIKEWNVSNYVTILNTSSTHDFILTRVEKKKRLLRSFVNLDL